ncbi:MAG TPA: 3-deoxy-D-manno-octulosonic acid transferase, partial [Planctomycetota bacterium]|nr:3-deoxy-D-manno-octulosonic acid transferase [Planctomycetota bacterium]
DLGYLAAGLLASPVLAFKLATDPRYRHCLGERFGRVPPSPGGPTLWLHCASVGEVTLARPIVANLKKSRPDLKIHVTVNTMAGRENATKTFPDATVSYFPLDFGGSVRRALRRIRPVGVVLVELEVWPNFVRRCAAEGLPVVVVNGRMSERSFGRYRAWGAFFRPIFRRLAAVGVQDDTYAGRLKEMGAEPVVTGNLKYDAAIGFDPEAEEKAWRAMLGLGEAPVLVGGSTHDPEERILCDTYKKLRKAVPGVRMVLAPRHLERVPEVQKAVEAADLKCYKRTQLTPGGDTDAVILLDSVGELSRVYAAATAVFIGGTFCARGGQNMLEPAALGKPVISGPSLSNFEEIARTLVEAGGMRVIDNPVDLAGSLAELLKDPKRARQIGARSLEAIKAGRGAVDRTMDLIEKSVLKGT